MPLVHNYCRHCECWVYHCYCSSIIKAAGHCTEQGASKFQTFVFVRVWFKMTCRKKKKRKKGRSRALSRVSKFSSLKHLISADILSQAFRWVWKGCFTRKRYQQTLSLWSYRVLADKRQTLSLANGRQHFIQLSQTSINHYCSLEINIAYFMWSIQMEIQNRCPVNRGIHRDITIFNGWKQHWWGLWDKEINLWPITLKQWVRDIKMHCSAEPQFG